MERKETRKEVKEIRDQMEENLKKLEDILEECRKEDREKQERKEAEKRKLDEIKENKAKEKEEKKVRLERKKKLEEKWDMIRWITTYIEDNEFGKWKSRTDKK
jgi:chromatin assembly factor 1 subunit A